MKDAISEIKALQEKGKLTIGTEETMKNLKAGKVKKIFVCSNPSDQIKEDLEYYGKVSGVEIVHLDIPNDELGTICRKPFAIAVLST
ncbi:MAG: ribosomal L7Ae/L30e/S12e/Gadd45 family protein [Candidatus Nanoarchaeia archaeon]